MKKQYFSFLAAMFVFSLATMPAACAQDGETKAGNKFLVIAELKDAFYSLSADERMELMKASDIHVTEAVRAGNILAFYNVPGWNRVVVIEQRDSIEDLYKHFEEEPMYPYGAFQVYPLTDSLGELAAAGIEQAKPDPEKMRFLVIAEAKDTYFALPPDERTKIDSRPPPFQTDNLLAMYGVPGWNRSVAIEQYDSIEALYKHFEEDAFYPYGDFEVYPLYELDYSE